MNTAITTANTIQILYSSIMLGTIPEILTAKNILTKNTAAMYKSFTASIIIFELIFSIRYFITAYIPKKE